MFTKLKVSLAGLVVVAGCLTAAGTPARAAVECGAGHTTPHTVASAGPVTVGNDGSIEVYLDDTIDSTDGAYCGEENAYVAYNHPSELTPSHTVVLEAYVFYGPDQAHLSVVTSSKSASGQNGAYFDAPLAGQPSVGSTCGMAMVTAMIDGHAMTSQLLTAYACPGA